jgi:hypothetical protein
MWTYGIQFWGTTSTSNIEILESFQSKTLRIITDAPWYVPNETIRKDLEIPTVKEEISHHSTQYSKRLTTHAIATTPANRSAHQIQYVIVVVLTLVIKV